MYVYRCVQLHTHTYMLTIRGYHMSCSVMPYLVPLRQGPLLDLDYADSLQASEDPPVSIPNTRVTGRHMTKPVGTGDSNSGPHACTASALTH